MERSALASLAILLLLPPLCVAVLGLAQGGLAQAQVAGEEGGERASLSSSVLKDAREVYARTSQRLSPEYGHPRSIVGGCEWRMTDASTWTSGFFAGTLWQLYERFGDDELLLQARRWTEGLEAQASASTHDLGFMINNSFGRGHRSAGIDGYRDVTLLAARQLAARFDPRVGAIKAWDSTGGLTYPVLIDTMMNLEILF